METRRALLLIADIGGYTQYMQFHRTVLGHAEAATSRMLAKVVDAAPGFDLIEIEGDAAFLARHVDGMSEVATLDAVTDAAVTMHRAFHVERQLVQRNLCPCQSCTQISDLTLKFVAHVGEVATQTIRRRRKLVGVDVILVHRLLKNSVEVREYVLLSDELVGGGRLAAAAELHEVAQELEDIGPVRTWFLDVADLTGPSAITAPSWPHRIGATVGMLGRGLRARVRPARAGVLADRAPASG